MLFLMTNHPRVHHLTLHHSSHFLSLTSHEPVSFLHTSPSPSSPLFSISSTVFLTNSSFFSFSFSLSQFTLLAFIAFGAVVLHLPLPHISFNTLARWSDNPLAFHLPTAARPSQGLSPPPGSHTLHLSWCLAKFAADATRLPSPPTISSTSYTSPNRPSVVVILHHNPKPTIRALPPILPQYKSSCTSPPPNPPCSYIPCDTVFSS